MCLPSLFLLRGGGGRSLAITDEAQAEQLRAAAVELLILAIWSKRVRGSILRVEFFL